MKITGYIGALAALLAGLVLVSCSNYLDDDMARGPVPLSVDFTVEDRVDAYGTRTTADVDGWIISSFSVGDLGGIYATSGIQDPEDPNDFSKSVSNGKVYCQSSSGTSCRFGNSDIVVDPTTLSSNNNRSIIYYPYFEDMPDPQAEEGVGMPIRVVDPDDPENNERLKCIDFMHSYSTGTNTNISVSNGQMSPRLSHYFPSLIIQRGVGFSNAPDQRVWVVTKDTYSHLRVVQATPTSYFDIKLDNNFTETGDEAMVYIQDKETGENISRFKVDKNCVWEAWPGRTEATRNSRYVVIPPVEVAFILMQDDLGNWQNVSDFYLSSSGSRKPLVRNKYTLSVSQKGAEVVARPISVTAWNENEDITDNRKVGISYYNEYNDWVSLYNTYIQYDRSEEYHEALSHYGDGVYNTATGRTSWTFYINDNIVFPPNETDFYQITKLDDVLEGSSTYTNYRLDNFKNTLIGEMTENGILRALEVRDFYFIQPSGATTPYSPLIGTLNGGTVENIIVRNGIVISSNAAGMIAGKAIGGTVTGCTISGDVIGSSAPTGFEGIFGEVEGAPTVTGNNTSGLKYLPN